MNSKYEYGANYVEPGVRADLDLVSSRQAGEAVSSLVAAYREQQRRVLQGVIVEGEPSTGRKMSSAGELAERRRTSAMYLAQQRGAAALATAGLVTLFWLGGSLQGIQALALWIFCTGALSLLLSAWQHRQELRLSPENIELERLEHDAYLGEYDAATQGRQPGPSKSKRQSACRQD